MSRDFVEGFIETYRENPCLWKIKSKDYTNKNLKSKAYEKLVNYCKLNGYQNATKDFVMKKIVEASTITGTGSDDIYEPNLWYYSHLLFTKDQEIPSSSEESAEFSESTHEESLDSNYGETEDAVREEISTNKQVNTESFKKPETPTKSVDTPRGQKRKLMKTQEDFMISCTNALRETKTLTENEAIALTIAKKLQRMDAKQQLLAKGLINKVLMGLFKELTRSTDIYNPPQPNINYTSSNVLHSQDQSPSTSDISIAPVSTDLIFSDYNSRSSSNYTNTPDSPIMSTNLTEYYENMGTHTNL